MKSIVTGEIAGSDKLASNEAVKGFFDGLQNSNHLNAEYPQTFAFMVLEQDKPLKF